VKPPESKIFKAEKELKEFTKVFLRAGEERVVQVTFDERAFSFYNINMRGWHTETGVYRILAASSSQDVRLDAELAITSDQIADVPDYRLKAPAYYSLGNYGHGIPKEQFEAVFGSRIEDPVIPHKGVFDLNSTVSEVSTTWAGRMMKKQINKEMAKAYQNAGSENEALMMKAMINDLPLRSIALFSDGKVGIGMIEALILVMNGHLLKGIWKLITK
jgi:beta-glucosidase